jgi:hypothetical protein
MSAEYEQMKEEIDDYNSSFAYTPQVTRRKKKKIDDLDYFQCLCGVAMRESSLKTHWRLYCRLTQGMPELLKSPFLEVPVLPLSESQQNREVENELSNK